MGKAKFSKNDFVRRISNPDVAGIVREVRWDGQAESWHYRVQFGNALRGVPEDDLERPPVFSDPWSEVVNGAFAGWRAFVELMTYERLRKPPSRIAAAFGSAKAAFYPYQFKPLLKLLENPRQRLLIVDDVGLGKTIEAGYIIRELRARHELDRVLIVVPARLRNKWKDELERRFSESFEVVRAPELKRALERLTRGDDLPRFRWITSYESARNERFIEQLEQLQPAIDLVVVDEAHRMRNTSSAQHKLGLALSASADCMIMLTATPVQTGIDNLYSLLHILDPDQFAQADVFYLQWSANRALVRALRAVRERPPQPKTVEESLESFALDPMSGAIGESDFYNTILERIRRLSQLSREEVIALEKDMGELSLTGAHISRTRKVDVFPDRPQRRAHVFPVVFTPEEQRFYDAVAALCKLMRPELTGWGRAMSALMAYRYTASCIPAAVELFRRRTVGLVVPLETDEDEDSTDSASDRDMTESVIRRLSDVVQSLAPPEGVDSKYDAFRSGLRALWKEDQDNGQVPRKVVLFSYFKRTLAYLAKRLAAEGIEYRHIDGDVPIEEREARIEQFASSGDVRLLLSSEVGGEGLDLQFASVIFNYDLPWNPMVVEQRIGRIDRIGQESKVITILNLVAQDTVESRILLRLYERIGIFTDTIGDIDPILGEPLQKLELDVLRSELSATEAARVADEAIDALKRQDDQARSLVRDADGLMAADQAFLDEVEDMVGRRRLPAAEELHAFSETFFSRHYPGSRVPKSLVTSVASVEVPSEAGHEMRRVLAESAEAGRFSRLVESGPFPATFSQATALRHARAELLHTRHPLLRFAFHVKNKKHLELHRSFALQLPSSVVQGPWKPQHGLWAFGIWLYDITGGRPRVDLVPFFVLLGSEACVEGTEGDALLQAMLAAGTDATPTLPAAESLEAARRVLLSALHRHKAQWVKRETGLGRARLDRQRATLSATFDARVNAATTRHAKLQSSRAADFAVRMALSKMNRAIEDRRSRLAALSTVPSFGIEEEEIAMGLLDVTV